MTLITPFVMNGKNIDPETFSRFDSGQYSKLLLINQRLGEVTNEEFLADKKLIDAVESFVEMSNVPAYVMQMWLILNQKLGKDLFDFHQELQGRWSKFGKKLASSVLEYTAANK